MPPVHMIKMVSRDVLFSIGPGLILGMAAYTACARVISPILYGVHPLDPIWITVALIAIVAAFAGFIPARRALSIAPTEALRQE